MICAPNACLAVSREDKPCPFVGMDLWLGREFAPQAFNWPPGIAERLAQAKHVYNKPPV
jgi:hypothetical protein